MSAAPPPNAPPVESADLHVETTGAGPLLVLAHGFAGSARNWRPQVRALADRRRILTFDARGHARSPSPGRPQGGRPPRLGDGRAVPVPASPAVPPRPDAYSLDGFAAELEALALAEGAAELVVGGLSMGAAVALQVALAGRLPLRGLVLASPPAGAKSGGVAAFAEAFAASLESEGLEAAGARFVWGEAQGLGEAGARLVRQGFLEHDPLGLARVLRGVLAQIRAPEEMEPELRGLEVPVLVVVGADDTGSVAAGRALAERLPNARFEVIPAAGHVVNLVAQASFNELLLAFLGELG